MGDRTPEERFEELVQAEPRFAREAYVFLFDALDYTTRQIHQPGSKEQSHASIGQHVNGQDLLEGIRQHAIQQFGCLASAVFELWGVRSSEDIGEMVFQLVDQGLMGCRDCDDLGDFDGGFGGRRLPEVFAVEPALRYCPERDEWEASYRSDRSD